jgi:hypothetical protein
MADYQPYWAARGHLFARAGRKAKALKRSPSQSAFRPTRPFGNICGDSSRPCATASALAPPGAFLYIRRHEAPVTPGGWAREL